MPFSGVNILKSTEDCLRMFLKSKTDSGIFLLNGTSKEDREKTAFLFAKHFLCQGVQDSTCPCASCKAVQSNHPDFYVLKPSASGNMLSADVKGALEFLDEMSIFSDRRALIIEDIDRMTITAQDHILSILEQRMEGVLFLATTSDINLVSKTTKSRMPILLTSDIETSYSYNRLSSQKGSSAKRSLELSLLAPHLSSDVVLDQEDIMWAHKHCVLVLFPALKGDPKKSLNNLLKAIPYKKEKDFRLLVEMIMCLLGDMMKVKMTAASKITMPSRIEWYEKIREELVDEDLDFAMKTFRKVLVCPSRLMRPNLLWAIGKICENLKYSGKELA